MSKIKINLKIGEKNISLSISEAKEIYDNLKSLFEKEEMQHPFIPETIPTTTPNPWDQIGWPTKYPYWHPDNPWNPTCFYYTTFNKPEWEAK